MTRSRHSSTARLCALALSIVALLVLCLGLPRVLVVCSGPHCDQQIEFAHHSSHCCEPEQHEHEGSGSGDPCADHGDCVDVALGEGVVPAPLPRTVLLPEHDVAYAAVMPFVLQQMPCWSAPLRHPPATGPPRTDRRTELIASTLLLV